MIKRLDYSLTVFLFLNMSRKVFYPLLLLVIPLIGINFTDEIDWSLPDFIVAGLNLLVFSICANFIILKISNKNRRVVFITILLILFVLVWAELAVGIFGTPFAGS